MNGEHEELKKAVTANARLLNDVLEIKLRKLHGQEAIVVERMDLELAQLTAQYTRLYIDLFSAKN